MDTLAVGDGDGGNDLAGVEFPEAEGVGTLDPKSRSRLKDRDGNDEVGCENELLVPVDGKTVRRELLAENVKGGLDIFGPLVDDVEVGISFDETSGRGTGSG